MARILPSQVVQAIESLFGPSRPEIYSLAITKLHHTEVHTLLLLLDELPRELILHESECFDGSRRSLSRY
jgi:hypothetical protein